MKKILITYFLSLIISAAHGATEIRDTEIETALYKWSAPLLSAAEMPPAKIHIVNDKDFNAFVRGGTDIYVNSGLLEKINSASEFQAVLAHELGHVVLGHMVQMRTRIQTETTRTMIMQALGIGMMVVNPQAAIGVMAGATGIATQSMLAFTRDEERAADDYAVKLLSKANIDQSALLSVFKNMQNTSNESKINPNNISHPLTEERIKNIKLHIKEDNLSKDDSQLSALKMIQAKLIGYLDTPEHVKTLYSDKSAESLYATAISESQSGDLESAKNKTLALIKKDPKNPYFYELLGDIEFQNGYYDDSINAYESAIKLKKDAPQIEIAMALVLSERKKEGDLARASELCKKTLTIEPMPLAYWALAKSDAKRADYYLAEFYYMTGDIKRAKTFAKKAVKNLPKKSPEYLKSQDLLSVSSASNK